MPNILLIIKPSKFFEFIGKNGIYCEISKENPFTNIFRCTYNQIFRRIFFENLKNKRQFYENKQKLFLHF